jgi:hypothetical protein
MKLTTEQKNVINEITSAFKLLNASANSTGGIIGISEIVDTEKKRLNRNIEINLIQKTYDDLRTEQVMQDIEKIRPEIEALGLKVQKYYDAAIKIFDESSDSWNWTIINYKYQWKNVYRNEYESYDSSKDINVYHTFALILNEEDKYGGYNSFDTIEEFVKYEKFRDRLSSLYRSQKNK